MLGLKSGLKSGLIIGCATTLLGMQLPALANETINNPISSHGKDRFLTLQTGIKTVSVPAQSVFKIALAKSLSSQKAELGQTVLATVTSPVYVGPYLVVPPGASISGKIIDINRKAKKNGPNPYIVVNFNELSRPGNPEVIPINAELIAYKTGLNRDDYLWSLPQKKDKLKQRLGSAAEGAVFGFFINPIIGPVIGAGTGVLTSTVVDKVAQHGTITLKAGKEIPIAVQEPFKVPIATPMVTNAVVKNKALLPLIRVNSRKG